MGGSQRFANFPRADKLEKLFFLCGAVAQLGERLVRNEEASGSIPLSSTNKIKLLAQKSGSIKGTGNRSGSIKDF